MTLEQLEKIFISTEVILPEDVAKEKAFIVLKCIQDNHLVIEDDYWIQLGKDWDLNIFDGKIYGGESITKMTLYKILPNGKTDTLNDGIQLI